jgi:hypothetical protein
VGLGWNKCSARTHDATSGRGLFGNAEGDAFGSSWNPDNLLLSSAEHTYNGNVDPDDAMFDQQMLETKKPSREDRKRL